MASLTTSGANWYPYSNPTYPTAYPNPTYYYITYPATVEETEMSEEILEITEVEFFQDDDVCGVRLNVKADFLFPDDGEFEVTGSARRDPVDDPDHDLAMDLAYGRALQKVANKLLKRAEGKIRQQDNDIKQRKASAEQKAIANLKVRRTTRAAWRRDK